MKFNEIMKQLSGRYRIRILSGEGKENLLDLAFLDGQTRLFPETWLLFGYGDQCPSELPPSLVLFCSPKEEAEAVRNFGRMKEALPCRNLALVPRAQAGAFFNDVRTIIEKNRRSGYYDAVTEAMDQIRDIPSFIDTASLSFGASLVLCDIEYRILAWSSAIPVTDPLWKDNIQKGYCDYEFIREVRRLKSVQTMGDSGEAFEVSCSQSPFRKIASMIYVRGEAVGFLLLIEGEDSFRDVHPRMISSLARALSYGIPRYEPSWVRTRSRMQRLLYNLLIGADLSDLSKDPSGQGETGTCRVVCCRSEKGEEADPALSDEAERILEGSVAVRHQKALYILLEEADGASLHKTEFLSFLEDLHLNAGVSPCFEGLGRYREACRMAERALLQGKERVRFFEDHLPPLLLSVLSEHTDPAWFVHPAIRALEESDRENGTHLLDTLSVYLENGESIRNTAESLFLHRNSVIYRLGKIQEISGADLSDPGIRFALRIGLAVLAGKRGKAPGPGEAALR